MCLRFKYSATPRPNGHRAVRRLRLPRQRLFVVAKALQFQLAEKRLGLNAPYSKEPRRGQPDSSPPPFAAGHLLTQRKGSFRADGKTSALVPAFLNKAKLDELRSYLYANRESVRGYAKPIGTESVFRLPCGEHGQSIDQLAHVQEAPKGMEPSRSPAIASRENRDYQRATGPLSR